MKFIKSHYVEIGLTIFVLLFIATCSRSVYNNSKVKADILDKCKPTDQYIISRNNIRRRVWDCTEKK